ncbi:DUF58 domain-containing protein [Natrialba swarupiae]|uniref:DUF58 domain-containing protein n=1 Tax=Natrialba swarupiae TaxID=2448032 RepID=UPI001EE46D59|nr:DUF58 domain-containing protein [Natrialba swarupiae]
MTWRQHRWRGAVAATILLVALGVARGNGAVLLGAVVPLLYVAYGALSRASAPEDLVVRRTISPTPAPPGRPVTVSLEVENDGERTLTDVRVADAVPADLAVTGGSPRGSGTLEPGDRIVLEYAVVARRGEYEFDPPQVRVRGLGAGAVVTTEPAVDGDSSLACRLDADAPPLEQIGTGRIGQLTTDRPGEGLTFHSTREYRPDDPADRIDWRHYAKRGSLATVNYERQVAATVVLVVDAREPNRVVAGPGRPTAVELSAYAATRALTDLLAHGHDVGVAAIGLSGPGPAGLHWLEPASGSEQRARGLEIFRDATGVHDERDPEQSSEWSAAGTSNWERRDRAERAGGDDRAERTNGRDRTEQAHRRNRAEQGHGRMERTAGAADVDDRRADEQIRKLIELAPAGAQVALFSPLLDDRPVEAVETWRGGGLPSIVLSPDVVPENTVSGQYAQIRRRTRLARCQSVGTRAVDWRRGTPLPLIIEYAFSANARLSSGRLGANAGSGGRPGDDESVDPWETDGDGSDASARVAAGAETTGSDAGSMPEDEAVGPATERAETGGED